MLAPSGRVTTYQRLALGTNAGSRRVPGSGDARERSVRPEERRVRRERRERMESKRRARERGPGKREGSGRRTSTLSGARGGAGRFRQNAPRLSLWLVTISDSNSTPYRWSGRGAMPLRPTGPPVHSSNTIYRHSSTTLIHHTHPVCTACTLCTPVRCIMD